MIISLTALALAVAFAGCAKKEPVQIKRPWINNNYSYLTDLALQEKVDQNDTLAALTLGWRYLQNKDTLKAATLFFDFNRYFDKASHDLNYLTAISLMGSRADTLAIPFIRPLLNDKNYPEAKDLLANAYKGAQKYQEALELYRSMPSHKGDSIQDSIMRCKAELGDTLSGIEFASKMLAAKRVGLATRYFTKYVDYNSKNSPAFWRFEAGKAYFLGLNFERASKYLENADDDTTFTELSSLLGQAYYRLKTFDSASSKLTTAVRLGDSTASILYLLFQSLNASAKSDSAVKICLQGIRLYPEDERFYYLPARYYYEKQEYVKLREMAQEGLSHIKSSYKLESYYIASLILLKDTSEVNRLTEKMIGEFKFYPGALSEAAKLFRSSLKREDLATRLESADVTRGFPEVQSFLTWYQRIKSEGLMDSARAMLDAWLKVDTVARRVEIIKQIYEADFHKRPK